MLPNFVIIGAQKSASTFLQECLNDHPDIYLPKGETSFFESPDYEESEINDLKKLFDGKNEKCLGIKRPNYIGKPEVPGRIESELPEAKLIAVLRNPIERAASAYYHLINYGFLPPVEIETGMRKILNDASFVYKYKRSLEVIEFGYYWKYLKQYQHFISNKNLLVLLHEDIKSNPLENIQKVYQFLSVNPKYIPPSIDSRPQVVIYNLTRLKFITLRNKYIYNYDDNKTRLFLRNCNFSERMIAGTITKFDKYVLSKITSNTRPKLSQELKNILIEKYTSDINSVEDFLGRDLSSWKS